MERVRPVVLVLSTLLVAAAGARGRLRRGSAGGTDETGRRDGRSPLAVAASDAAAADPTAAGLAATATRTSGAPRTVARLDRGLAALGTVGLLATLGLAGWEAAGVGPRLPAAGGLDWPLVALLATVIVWAVYLFWKVPQWQAGGRHVAGLDGRERFEVENAARTTLGQMLSGVAVLAGLLFAWQQLGSTSETLRVSQEGQITERFTRAVDQIGSDDGTIRLGGIYALERIARDSERDRGPVTEVLAAYVREHAAAGWRAEATPTPGGGVPVDVRAVLAILTTPDAPRNGTACLDLSGTDLSGIELPPSANLRGACLRGTLLANAQLPQATLTGAILTAANLSGADLGGANLDGAQLDAAVLVGTNASRAGLAEANLLDADARTVILTEATLDGTSFNGTDLTDAILFGVDLSRARALTQEQVDSAATDGQTRWPAGLEARPDM